ncbi:hypothetical protein C2G38_2074521 [Gigaspora rosea]|uniref:Uncharacterized protein n=1 Tax=Gigaspora rosea TaxID=44941 RepID=A0A397VK06_9GLOM|nr:hypothetical protein C2G38_2074521 [Gigaspora rosea]
MKLILSIVLFVCTIHFRKNVSAFVPSGRGEHSTVLVNEKLYFLGGWSWGLSYAMNQLFYLDVSRHFTMINIFSLPWTDLSSIPGLTNKTGAAASVDETTIFYIGGRHSGGLVSKFDTIS